MASQQIVIVNTGCANISSVKFAVERLGSHVTVSDDIHIIQTADKVFLPGVGSANAAMASIEKKQLVSCIQELTQPVLGICLGMQLMVEKSEESLSNNTPCLGLIPGQVKRLQVGDLRLPHMGWNTVLFCSQFCCGSFRIYNGQLPIRHGLFCSYSQKQLFWCAISS
jgi:glutamine amidotransferase